MTFEEFQQTVLKLMGLTTYSYCLYWQNQDKSFGVTDVSDFIVSYNRESKKWVFRTYYVEPACMNRPYTQVKGESLESCIEQMWKRVEEKE